MGEKRAVSETTPPKGWSPLGGASDDNPSKTAQEGGKPEIKPNAMPVRGMVLGRPASYAGYMFRSPGTKEDKVILLR